MDSSAVAWIGPALAGLSLAAATGLRAFLPLAVLAWAARLQFVPLHPSFAWLGSDAAVIAFSVAVVVELAGDKFPAVDHALDALATFVKPVAGTLVVAASLYEIDPLYAAIIGLVTGATLAGGIHLLKAKGRLVSNFFTAGLAAPILSLVEDALTVILVAIAFLVPLLGALIVAGFLYLIVRFLTRPRGAATS